MESLIRSGLVTRSISKDGTISIALTRRGRWEYTIRNFDFAQKKLLAWDGKWRVIVFDVPEHKRKIRRELRRAISLFGFEKLQQSVWVYPYPCDDFVEIVRSHLEIKNDIVYMTVENIENDVLLKRKFELKS